MVGSIIGGMICIIAGLWLLAIKARGENSMIEALANGIGIYCIGKGVYIISQGVQLSEIRQLFGERKKVCPQCGELVTAKALICRFCRFEFPKEISKEMAAKLKEISKEMAKKQKAEKEKAEREMAEKRWLEKG